MASVATTTDRSPIELGQDYVGARSSFNMEFFSDVFLELLTLEMMKALAKVSAKE